MTAPIFRAERSDEIRAQLVHMSNSERLNATSEPVASREPSKHRRVYFTLAASVAVALVGTIGIHQTATSAQANSVLHDLRNVSLSYSDLPVGPEQYLEIEHLGIDQNCSAADGEDPVCERSQIRGQRTFMPGDGKQEWAIQQVDNSDPTLEEVLHAPDGEFYGSNAELTSLLGNASDGETLYEFVDRTYRGGSLNRDESNFVRLSDALRTGTIPSSQRAAFYDALTRVPGVTVSLDVQTLDGLSGIAIGRTEPLRLGEREEIIVSPESGQVIGTRKFMTMAVMGYGKNEVIAESSIGYSVVNDVPAATRKVDWMNFEGGFEIPSK